MGEGHPQLGPRLRPISLVLLPVLAIIAGLSPVQRVAAADPNCPIPLVDRQRYGFVATSANWPQQFDYASLNAGWVVDFAYRTYSTLPVGLDRALVIRIAKGYRLDPAQLGPVVDSNPGVIWLIGNEPDCIWQDNVEPEEYARIYHDLYAFIKSRDQSSQVAAGGIVQPTPLRLEYLNRVLAAYQARYRLPMPVDMWNIHNAILNEVSCDYDPSNCWGAEIPPGIDADYGEIRSMNDNDNMTLFRNQIWAFRRWMADHGYGGYPLIVTEYGVLMPAQYGFDQNRVNTFMNDTFAFFQNTTDPTLGDPADGRRLVQRWAWFSLDVPPWNPGTGGFNGNLFDPETTAKTAFGVNYGSHTSSFPPLEYADLALGAWRVAPTSDLAGPGQTITRTVQTRIVNLGTADAGGFTARLAYTGPVTGALEQTVAGLPRSSAQWLPFVLTDLPAGRYSLSLTIDSMGQVAESRECNNQATTAIVAPEFRYALPLISKYRTDVPMQDAVAAAVSGSLAAQPGETGSAEPGFREFPVPTAASYPAQIGLDGQGRVWITERDANQIARFDPQTETWMEYPIPRAHSQPWGLAVDGQGNVWFAETAANQIAKLTVSSGVVTEYPVPTPNSQPWDIAVSGDTVWFTEKAGNRIAKLVASTGVISEYLLPTANAVPLGLAVLGNEVWFVESAAAKLARFKIDVEQFLEIGRPAGSLPQDIVLNPMGQPWFTEMGGNRIVKFEPSTIGWWIVINALTPNSEPYGIALEGVSAVWFTERAGNRLARYGPAAHNRSIFMLFEYGLPTPNSTPTGVAVDSNGCAWYAAPGANRIGRLCPPLNRLTYVPVIYKAY
ncbi:MAG: virginiamycin B lyase family protein [Anaerolineae bacterium]